MTKGIKMSDFSLFQDPNYLEFNKQNHDSKGSNNFKFA